jgi:N,N-dimethylformamidase
MYRFDKSRIDLAREFKARPYGEHSPDLQYLLHLMRMPSDKPFHALFMTEQDRRWTVALVEPGLRSPPRLTNMVFDKLEDAEWYVFRERWKALAGEDCPVE